MGNLHTNLSEDDLRAVFEPFGDIQIINLHTEPDTGRSKGFAFVQYKSPEDAKKALQHCNGMELAGLQLKVGLVSDAGTLAAAAMPGMMGGGSGLNELDDEGGGLGLNAQARAMLMAKLAGQIAPGGLSNLPGASTMAFPGLSNYSGLLPGVLPSMMPNVSGMPQLAGLGASMPLQSSSFMQATSGAPAAPVPTVTPRPTSSPYMLLKNMFDPAQ